MMCLQNPPFVPVATDPLPLSHTDIQDTHTHTVTQGPVTEMSGERKERRERERERVETKEENKDKRKRKIQRRR